MSWIGTKRIIKSGKTNFKRSGAVSLASILVMTVTLLVISFMIFFQAVLNFSLSQIKDKVDITVYFNVGASENKVMELKSYLENLPEVSSATYLSADEVLARFQTKHSDDYLTIQAIKEVGDNPLGAQINIKAKDASKYESIAKFLEGDSDLMKVETAVIDKINYHQNKVIIDRLLTIADQSQKLGFLVTLFLVIISILITFNTIRLAIYISKKQIYFIPLLLS